MQPCFEVSQLDEHQPTGDQFTQWEQKNYDVTLGDFLEKSFPNLFKFELDDNEQDDDDEAIGQIK